MPAIIEGLKDAIKDLGSLEDWFWYGLLMLLIACIIYTGTLPNS